MANNIDRPNIPDDDYKRNLVRRIESIYDEKESEKGKYLKTCQDLNSRIDDILEEAKNKGIPKKSLKGIIKLRELDRKKEALVEALEDDQQEILKSIEEALGEYGDTPLGAAAISANNKATVGTAGETTLEKAKASRRKPQDETTAAIVGAVLGDESKTQAGNPELATNEVQTHIEDAIKNQAEIDEQRARDAAAFDADPPVSKVEDVPKEDAPKADNVARLDPAAARRNRGGKTKSEQASDALKAAEERSEQNARSLARNESATEGLKIVGAEPGPIKF